MQENIRSVRSPARPVSVGAQTGSCGIDAAETGRRYLLIVPCRNEALHLGGLLDSIADQDERPAACVFVDDGSTDATPEILEEAASRLSYVHVVSRPDRGYRSVGPGVIEAFYAALEGVALDSFDYVCKLDADLVVPRGYFARLMDQMEGEVRLGTVSGKVYIRDRSGTLQHEARGDENSVGPCKFYRVSCFRDIGGFERHVGWDGVDGHVCRMRGWIARSIDAPGLRLTTNRPMGASDAGVLRGRVRAGGGLWYIGYDPLYVMARTLCRVKEPPVVVGTCCTLWGYLKAMVTRQPRYGDREYRHYIRTFQRRALLLGKHAAVERWDRAARGGA